MSEEEVAEMIDWMRVGFEDGLLDKGRYKQEASYHEGKAYDSGFKMGEETRAFIKART